MPDGRSLHVSNGNLPFDMARSGQKHLHGRHGWRVGHFATLFRLNQRRVEWDISLLHQGIEK